MSLGYEAFVERPEHSTVTRSSFVFKGCLCTVVRTVTTFPEGPYVVTRRLTTIFDPAEADLEGEEAQEAS
ncbi:MAG TPA: hypothetical protein VNZ54_02575 [bacterium]|nr:hypothetical protein [bacterium]